MAGRHALHALDGRSKSAWGMILFFFSLGAAAAGEGEAQPEARISRTFPLPIPEMETFSSCYRIQCLYQQPTSWQLPTYYTYPFRAKQFLAHMCVCTHFHTEDRPARVAKGRFH
ncbi:hypothetical protein B0T17DRAFT_318012 [Bombardia bombarda]|uniref:Uncharacterized protein n=1 Tax=Bombardia bombarda TaxID=252184 RepID=A0AA39WM73_9PEZI|nr:hypothetical protein B0T17DRAFT_318012 [Bombardia bombarda]